MAGKYELDLKAHLNSADLQKQIKAISKSQKIEITADGSKVIKETAKWSEGNNKIIKQVQTIDAETGKVTSTLRTVNQSAQKLNQSFGDVVMKVSKFLLATTVISGFTTTIYGAVDAVKDFDDAITDFKKVSDLDGEALDNYGKKLGQLGLDVARSRTEMVNASAEFKKSGYSDEDSAILSKVASEFQNVADSELSAGESASFIISQMKAFNITATEAEDIIDKVNIVSNNFSVSSTDISSGLTKSSASLATYGNTIEETIGMISAG